MNADTATNPYYQVHQSLVNFQLKRRFMAVAYDLSPEQASQALNYTELIILLILDAEASFTIKDVAKEIQIERSWTSRVVMALEKKGFIKTIVPETDKRSKVLKVTSKGKKALLEALKIDSEILQNASTALDQKEGKLFEQYLKAMADGQNVPNFLTYTEVHPTLMELFRMTRSAGLHSQNYMGTALNRTQIEVLNAVNLAHPSKALVSDLSQALPYDMSTISRTITALEKAKCTQKKQSRQDKRVYFIEATKEGKKVLKDYQKKASALFKKVLAVLSTKELEDFLLLLEKVTTDMPKAFMYADKENIEVKPLESNEEKKQVLELLQNKMEGVHTKPSYGLYVRDELKGAISLDKNAVGKTDITLSVSDLDENESLSFLKACGNLIKTVGK